MIPFAPPVVYLSFPGVGGIVAFALFVVYLSCPVVGGIVAFALLVVYLSCPFVVDVVHFVGDFLPIVVGVLVLFAVGIR